MNAPAEPTVADAIAQVAHALRVAASQDADRDFWRQRDRALVRANEALRWSAHTVLSAIDYGVPPSSASLERLRSALAQLEAIEASVTAHLAGVRA